MLSTVLCCIDCLSIVYYDSFLSRIPHKQKRCLRSIAVRKTSALGFCPFLLCKAPYSIENHTLSPTHYVVSKRRKFLENQYATEPIQHKCVDNIKCNMCHYLPKTPGAPNTAHCKIRRSTQGDNHKGRRRRGSESLRRTSVVAICLDRKRLRLSW